MEEEIKAKIKAQTDLQNAKVYPDFAPSDGVCWHCKNQIYEKISLNSASKVLITGCPFCGKSYCD